MFDKDRRQAYLVKRVVMVFELSTDQEYYTCIYISFCPGADIFCLDFRFMTLPRIWYHSNLVSNLTTGTQCLFVAIKLLTSS